MAKFFNTTGPCRAEDHYMLDPLNRLRDLRALIDDKQYFVIHAPHQTCSVPSPSEAERRAQNSKPC